jgi:DNA-binding transcriptional ArsR family regulator
MTAPLRAPIAVPIFAALGDPYRLSIVERLCEHGPLSTVMLTEDRNGLSRQGLTKHLHVLMGAGLVDSFRVGRDRHWQVRTEQLATLRAYLDHVSMEWDARLQRLQSLVADGDGNASTGGA